MVQADLVTGFLGAGKTTFIRKYAMHLIARGHRVCILENDYGAINVDMCLLSDLKSDALGLEMVAGGCDYDCHRRRFKTKLITIAMLGYDRVIIEPSGIFDVDEFFDILHEDPLDQRYRIGNVITVVRPGTRDGSPEADYLLASQAANAGTVLLSCAQETSPDDVQGTLEHLNRALARISCPRTFVSGRDFLAKDWEDLSDADYDAMDARGHLETSFEKRFSMDENGFRSLFYMDVQLSPEETFQRIRDAFADPATGNIHRIKGFCPKEDGTWIRINATPEELQTGESRDGQRVLIVIGEDLNEPAIDRYFPSQYSTSHWR
ncbi:MAG: GTPase (G3E family) [Lachnospiraceae bacterium]|nr:GTPase (G3E family) [Lachnospiraceae bacterium]